MEDDRVAVEVRVDLGGDRRRRVDDQYVARPQVLGQVPEPAVGQPVGGRDEQPHLVAGEAPGLGRARREGGGLEVGVRGLVQERHPKSSAR